MAIRQKLKLGDVLVQAGAITQQQLIQALNEQKQNNVPLGKALVELGYISEENLLNSLATGVSVSIFFGASPSPDTICWASSFFFS